MKNRRKNKKERKANPKIVSQIKIRLGMIHLMLLMFKLISKWFLYYHHVYFESYKINEKLKLILKYLSKNNVYEEIKLIFFR